MGSGKPRSREATDHHSAQDKFAIRHDDRMPIPAPTGDDIARQGEPAWSRKERGYAPHTGTRELLNLATDPSQKYNLYATETAKVDQPAALMELRDGRAEYAGAETEERRRNHPGQTGLQTGDPVTPFRGRHAPRAGQELVSSRTKQEP